jgi:hypothetical protein
MLGASELLFDRIEEEAGHTRRLSKCIPCLPVPARAIEVSSYVVHNLPAYLYKPIVFSFPIGNHPVQNHSLSSVLDLLIKLNN